MVKPSSFNGPPVKRQRVETQVTWHKCWLEKPLQHLGNDMLVETRNSSITFLFSFVTGTLTYL